MKTAKIRTLALLLTALLCIAPLAEAHSLFPTPGPTPVQQEDAPNYGAFANVDHARVESNADGNQTFYYENVTVEDYQKFGVYLENLGFTATYTEVNGSSVQLKITNGQFNIGVVYDGAKKDLQVCYEKDAVLDSVGYSAWAKVTPFFSKQYDNQTKCFFYLIDSSDWLKMVEYSKYLLSKGYESLPVGDVDPNVISSCAALKSDNDLILLVAVPLKDQTVLSEAQSALVEDQLALFEAVVGVNLSGDDSWEKACEKAFADILNDMDGTEFENEVIAALTGYLAQAETRAPVKTENSPPAAPTAAPITPTPKPIVTQAPVQYCSYCGGSGMCSHCAFGECDHCFGYGTVDCSRCSGTGTCQRCYGLGWSNVRQRKGEIEYVKCTTCNGNGKCSSCQGSGNKKCTFCNGSGNCLYCHGSGHCTYCNGTGRR